MKRFLLLLLFILMFFYVRVNALELNSKYAVLYNLNEDKVIYELNKDDVVSVASLTKIMTTLVAVENIKDYNQEVILKEEMFFGLKEANAYVINLRVGQKVTYNDLLYGMFLASGADATRAVAISVAGSEEKFVELMNNKAKEIDLKNTHFQNTVGLDAENHHSTVNEIAILLKTAFKNDKFKEIFMTETYTVSDGTITVRNSMKKAAAVYGIDVSNILGAKTGYTGNAGRCLASIAYDSDNDITYLLVTTKASTIKEPVLDASTTYDYFFKNYKYQDLVKKNDLLVELDTKYSNEKSVKFFARQDIKKYLKNDYSNDDVELKYSGKNIITPVMKKNENIGRVDVFYKGEKVKSISIDLTESIKFSFLGFIIYYKYIFISAIVLLVGVAFLSLKLKKFKKL